MRSNFVVPSLKISGGIREVLKLGERLSRQGVITQVICMWISAYPMETNLNVVSLSRWPPRIHTSLFQIPILALRFLKRFVLSTAKSQFDRFIFTHYVTLPLALFVPRGSRFFFVQDLEWKFIHNRFFSFLLRVFILFLYRRGTLISANNYLSAELSKLRLHVALDLSIWADPSFYLHAVSHRDLDFAMVLRKGDHKRLDLYEAFIELAAAAGYKIAVISPDDEVLQAVSSKVAVPLLRPSGIQMRDLYARSRCFIHLSEHEGFGLPPLEAMGAGCVPLCRDSGGVRVFMSDPKLKHLLLPLALQVGDIFSNAKALLNDASALAVLQETCKQVFMAGLGQSDRGVALCRELLERGSNRE